MNQLQNSVIGGDFYQDYKILFDSCFIVDDKAISILGADLDLDKNLTKIFNALTLAKALKSFESILLLCAMGRGEDAAIILRCIEEQAVAQAYVNTERPKIELFFVHDNLRVISQDSAISKWEKLVGVERSEELKQVAKDFRKEVKVTIDHNELDPDPDKPWYCTESINSLAKLAVHVDNKRNDEKKTLENLIRGPYGILSSYVHSTATALLDFAKLENKQLKIIDRPSHNRIKQVLIHGVECIVAMTLEAVKIMEIPIDTKSLTTELERCQILGKSDN